jgi:hypothetical protein
MSGIPSFTILEPPSWEDMYKSNIMPSNNPFPNYEVQRPITDYESLTGRSAHKAPRISQSYDDILINNSVTDAQLNQYNMPSAAPSPLESQIDLPSLNPPWGTPYPTNGYSPYDSELAINSNYSESYGLAGVPLASPPSLQDSRVNNNNKIAMGPADMISYAQLHFKEGYNAASNCRSVIDHIQSCPVCFGYMTANTKYYKTIIIILFIFVIILLFVLFRKKK